MGILLYMVLCNAALCVFHISLLMVALSKVLNPDIEMNGKSGDDFSLVKLPHLEEDLLLFILPVTCCFCWFL